MSTSVPAIVGAFEENTRLVGRLLDFDRVIIEAAVEGLDTLAEELEKEHLRNIAARKIRNRAGLLRGIKDNDSLRPQYNAIFNQCVVLLVSYFTSAIDSLFRTAVGDAFESGRDVPAAAAELRVSWRRLQASGDAMGATLADLLVAQQGISFQDMQSLRRAFKDQLGVEWARTEDTNNVILGQAARHVLVHAAGMVDDRMVRQVEGCVPRTLKVTLERGRPIEFSPDEVGALTISMVNETRAVASRLDSAIKALSPDVPA